MNYLSPPAKHFKAVGPVQTGLMCYQQGRVLALQNKHEEAIWWFLRGVNQHVHLKCYRELFLSVCQVTYSDAEVRSIETQAKSGDAEACFFLAFLLFWGKGGVQRDAESAYRYSMCGARANHVYSIFGIGYLLNNGFGVAKDAQQATRYFRRAANLGVANASREMGVRYRLGTAGVPQNLHLAAVYFLRGVRQGDDVDCHAFLRELMTSSDVAPWSQWSPAAEHHHFVPEHVHRSMAYWMLIAKRSPLCTNVAHLICGYLSTRNGWPDEGRVEIATNKADVLPKIPPAKKARTTKEAPGAATEDAASLVHFLNTLYD